MAATWQQLKAVRMNTGDLTQPFIIDDPDLSALWDENGGDAAATTVYALRRMIVLLETGYYVCDNAKERAAALRRILPDFEKEAGIYGGVLNIGTLLLGLDTTEDGSWDGGN